jgi:cysteinyl-tRNA synthetase
MALRFFNTLSRSVQDFVPREADAKRIGLYCCGPTVHDFAHIGNFRTFVFTDLVRRFLEFNGYAVRHVMNITDVEDKIIQRVAQQKTSLREYTAKYEAAFFEDFAALGCLRPHETPHATEFIPDIVALIEKLMQRGMAYRATDGSVYFSIEKYQAAGCRYGQLLKLNFEEMRPGARVSSDEYAKEAVADFALWKARIPEDGEVFWPSPWGQGRPGWHIECSAMSMKLLGPSFDLHMGGEDLIFPHHEDEIAQSEGAGLQAAQQPFVKYWLHGAHLLVEGRKMSKSLGNYFTVRDLLGKGFTGREIRYLLLQAHYRESFNFTMDGLRGARAALGRLDECLDKLREVATGATAAADGHLMRHFSAALEDDFNVSAAWGAIFEWVRNNNRLAASGELQPEQAAAGLAAWQKMVAVLGLEAIATGEAPAEVQALLAEREAARKARDFKRSDALRDQLKGLGWIIEDTPKGARPKRL